MKTLAVTFLSVAALLACTWAVFRLGLFNTSDQELMERYGAGTQMIELDGARFRMKDEGEGPAIFLAHTALHTLNYWDSWAEILRNNGYRVVRFDGPPEGLSDIDPKGHSHARLADLIVKLADKLEIDRFAVGGASRGGQAALTVAAEHPERVTHLLLTQTPVYQYSLEGQPKRIVFHFYVSKHFLSGYRSKYLWRAVLENLFEDQSALTDDIVQHFTDFANRDGYRERLAAVSAQASTRDREKNKKMAQSLQVPVLLIAAPNDNALSLAHQKTLASWFSDEVITFYEMPVGGHFPPLERGEETGTVVLKFMDNNQST